MRTIEQVREEFDRTGQTIAGWARQNCVSRDIVNRVLSGELIGKHGEAHKVAVLLGLKDGIILPEAEASLSAAQPGQ